MTFLRLGAAALLAGVFSSCALAQSLETAIMPGQVIEGHAKLEAECKNCHVRFDRSAQTGLCLDCHKKVARDFESRRGYHGRLPDKECRACHTDHKGRDAKIAQIGSGFDHRNTDFVLKGAHAAAKVECRSCHVPPKKFRDAPSDCHSCHQKDDKHKGKLGTACADCHTEVNWKQTKFDHGKTRFPLRDGHADVKCTSCHVDPSSKNTSMACVSCHKKDDQKKGHKGRFGEKCETCHTDKSWKTTIFRHERDTKYALNGLHATAKCNSCHRGNLYQEKLPTACVACHKADDAKKGHKGRFGEKCQTCHVEKGWKSTIFDHGRETKYLLKGKHALAKCTSCHTGFLYKEKAPTACVACHKADDAKKGHQGRFGQKCETCHIEKGWQSTIFDHGRDARYPLRGKHAQAKCKSCHVGFLYQEKLAVACVACHRKDDRHKNQLGPKCESCHNEASWKQTRIDHDLTRFPLLGKHAKAKCKDCHVTPQFKDAKTECYACHRKDDKHKLRLGTQCEVCHIPRSWKEWRFDHDRATGFVLDGKHRGLDCLACHRFPVRGRATLAGTCVSCHEDKDVHNGGFGRLCDRCHVSSSFKTIKSGGAGRLFQ
jgi:hypothetical protein